MLSHQYNAHFTYTQGPKGTSSETLGDSEVAYKSTMRTWRKKTIWVVLKGSYMTWGKNPGSFGNIWKSPNWSLWPMSASEVSHVPGSKEEICIQEKWSGALLMNRQCNDVEFEGCRGPGTLGALASLGKFSQWCCQVCCQSIWGLCEK